MATNPRKNVAILMRELGDATRRPLYVEIALIRAKQEEERMSRISSNTSRGAVEDAQTATTNKKEKKNPELSPQTSGVGVAMDTTSERSFSAATGTRRGAATTTTANTMVSPDEDERSSHQQRPNNKRTWAELLSEASDLVAFLTEEEHGKVLRIASILLLGFLLPYSTGNDFYLLQNNTDRPPSLTSAAALVESIESSSSSMDVQDYLLRLPLEERMEKSVKRMNLSSNGGQDGYQQLMTDPDLELALEDFLQQLGKLLQRRPLHREQVDLVHLLAMAIQPNVDASPYDDSGPKTTTANLLSSFAAADNPARLRTQRLMEMSRLYAHQFQIHSGHRRRLVQLVHEGLVLPNALEESSGDVVAPLLFGALLHLRVSLRNFDGACSSRELALAAAMSVAAQSRSIRILMKPEWDYFLNHMVDDRTDYQCAGICHCNCGTENDDDDNNNNRPDFFCPHSARGRVLGDFVVRSCRSRRDVDRVFLLHMTVSLTEAIEWQVDCWTDKKQEDAGGEEKEEEKLHAPCLLASLLHAAQQLFYFQPSSEDDHYVESEDDPYSTLIHTSIQLLRHPDTGIVTESAKLLVHAFSSTKRNAVDSYASLLFETVKVCLHQKKGALLSTLVSVISSQSPSFASALFSFLSEDVQESAKRNDSADNDPLYRLLAAISLNCPQTARQNVEFLTSLLNDASLPIPHSQHIFACILSSRLAYFFADENDKTQERLGKVALKDRLAVDSRWSIYQLAQLSLQTGNFSVAHVIFKSLLANCPLLSEPNYVWISLLGKIATAESSLSNNGAMGIPEATVALHSAASYLESLGLFSASWKESHEFQRWFLLLRLDFLDLVTVLRQLTREMRLTGRGPAKHTRSLLHLRNVVRGFEALSDRYQTLKQKHGMFFRDRQSGASLDVLQSLSSFMIIATKAVFSESLSSRAGHKDSSKSLPAGFVPTNVRHPVSSLLGRLDELIIRPMTVDSLDPLVRAAAMLEVIDGVLRVPVPIPRDFFVPQPISCSDFRISASPDRMFVSPDEAVVTIDSAPMQSPTFYVTGNIPISFLQQSRVPTWTILLWYRLDYRSPLVDDEDNNKDDDAGASEEPIAGALKMPDLFRSSPAVTTLFPDGHFFFAVDCPPLSEEGVYRLEARLGVRDAEGNEWDIPTGVGSDATVLVSRSL